MRVWDQIDEYLLEECVEPALCDLQRRTLQTQADLARYCIDVGLGLIVAAFVPMAYDRGVLVYWLVIGVLVIVHTDRKAHATYSRTGYLSGLVSTNPLRRNRADRLVRSAMMIGASAIVMMRVGNEAIATLLGSGIATVILQAYVLSAQGIPVLELQRLVRAKAESQDA